MITAGMDIGAMRVKVVLLSGGSAVGRSVRRCGFEPVAAAREALAEASRQAGLGAGSVGRTFVTGAGRKDWAADGALTDPTAAALGIHSLDPAAGMLVDVGAEEARCVKLGPGGRVLDFVVNEKCAAGTGAFVDSMAGALGVEVGEFGRMALEATRSIPMSAQCAVFAESEVVGLVHAGASPLDISRAVHESIAGRIVSMARRIGLSGRIALVGGMAENAGFVDALGRAAGVELSVPEHPAFVCALGAAIAAAAGA